MFVGIDLGQARIHIVALDSGLRLLDAWILDTAETDRIPTLLNGADMIAIDAPEEPSTAPHGDDETLSPKFRTARCAEIALGRERAIWVPWTTPTERELCPGWMKVGFDVFDQARKTGAEVVEVFPHAGFRVLAGTKVPPKLTAAGLLARAELLRQAGISLAGLDMWSHDSLDACLAALIAHQAHEGTADKVTCGHDSSAIWLPAA